MDTQEAAARPKGNGKRRKPIWVLLVLLILAGLAAAVFFFGRTEELPEEQPSYAPNAQVGMLPGKTEEEMQAELDEKVRDKMISFTLNSTPVFSDGGAEGDIMLESPDVNVNDIRFIIRRNDNDEVVYDSGLLKPNSYILNDTLQTKEPLPKGEYPCTATVLLVDPDTHEEKGRVQAGLTITIQS